MRGKISKRLWFYFISSVFIVLLTTAILTSMIGFILIYLGYFQIDRARPAFFIIGLIFISVLIGTILSIFVVKRILLPISKFNEAAVEVANGNFLVKLDDSSNVPEIKTFLQNFNSMTHSLSSIETLRNDFIVNVSHEFKTPLSAIEGYATLIQSEDLTKQEKIEYTDMIIEASNQLSTLTGHILELSKLENEDIILKKEIIQIDEQIRRSILWLESEWQQKQIEWDLELPQTNYWGNQRLSLQIWVNLIENAIKFTPKDGKISINLSSKDGKIIVSIADTGIGMSKETQKNIFDKFFQKDVARNVSGNGLGLSLVHRIVTIFHGAIDVESEEGKGSTFTVTLPMVIEKE